MEFARELCDIAEKNIAIYRSKTGSQTGFKIIHADAAQYPVQEDENVFFAFNPFAPAIFRQVIENIANSLKKRPRKLLIVIALASPQYREIVEQHPLVYTATTTALLGASISRFTRTKVRYDRILHRRDKNSKSKIQSLDANYAN